MPSTDFRTLRVDQIGSLIRPQYLKDAYARLLAGEATEQDWTAAQERAIREVVAAQERLRYPVISDGEFRRTNFQDAFKASVDGFVANPDVMRGAPGFKQGSFGKAVAKLTLRRNMPLEEWRSAQALTSTPVKPTVVSPAHTAFRVEVDPASGYAGVDEYLADVTAIQAQVIEQLVDAGCGYFQVDAPGYCEQYVDERRLAEKRAAGIDVAACIRRDLAADNAAIAGVAGRAVTGIHFCRGNFPPGSPMLASGGYEAIAEQAFNTLNHDRFLLEYDNERSGGFEPLRFVPKGKVVVLGLITTKVPELESPDQLKRRIDEAARYLPLEQLALSPQCGFSTAIGMRGDRMTEDQQWRKLELVQRVAAEVWG
jgi:5-methyltetrahydropteroyltriglutamate--homocysteine methyltransferase